MKRVTQGKCPKCRVRFEWRGKPLLRDAFCPTCHAPLSRTSHLLKWPTVIKTPIYVVGYSIECRRKGAPSAEEK